MTRGLYNFGITIASFLFNAVYWVSPKLRKRKHGIANQSIRASAQKRLWFHCSSAGEYEQIAEVIEGLANRFPHNQVFVTFFSPSGVEWMNSKKISYEYGYLPFDKSQKIKLFIEQVNPLFLVIAKNELWFNLLSHLHAKAIPCYLVSASIRSDFFALKRNFFSKHLSYFQGIYAQDEKSVQLLSKYNENTFKVGDTRISRIISKANKEEITYQTYFQTPQTTIVYGSIHPEDSAILIAIRKLPHFNHIIVPHDISKKSISHFTSSLGSSPTLSSSNQPSKSNFILIDEMGKLAQLYKQSDFAYIGGGFGKGIHNIVEPLIHNNIVFIGPRHQTFHEANFLVKKACIQVIDKPTDFSESLLNMVNLHPQSIKVKHNIAQQFIASHQKAAQIVVNKISAQLDED